MNELLWSPSKSKIENSNLYKFKNVIEKKYNLSFKTNYQDLWKWSVSNNENFWSECWDFFKINGTKKEEIIKRLLGNKRFNNSLNKFVDSIDCKSNHQKT